MEKGITADDPQGTNTLATRALALDSRVWYNAHAQAWLHLAGGYQLSGQLDRAYAVLATAQQEEAVTSPTPRLRLLAAPCFIHWMAAIGRHVAGGAADRQLQPGHGHQRESLGWGHCFLASVYYQRNDLAAAELHATYVQERRHMCPHNAVMQSVIMLAGIR